tara:strand:- start:247 stop:498 length:252 start_codon:yes stop_codon:yes gene_type:complete
MESIGAVLLLFILPPIVLFFIYGYATILKIVVRITKPLTPLFDYYLKLRIRKYGLYYIIEMIVAYIVVMGSFSLFVYLIVSVW